MTVTTLTIWYSFGHAVDSESDELKDLYSQFTELVNKADAITDDLDARYEAYAEAEAFMLDHALIVPAYFDISWELTRINDYSKHQCNVWYSE